MIRFKKEGLTEKQIKKLTRYSKWISNFSDLLQAQGRVKLQKQAARYRASNIANKRKKFYGTGLGIYQLKNKIKQIWNVYSGKGKYKGKTWNELTDFQQRLLRKESQRLYLVYASAMTRMKATKQVKQDRKEAYEFAKQAFKARVNAYRHGNAEFSETYYVHKSTAQSYEDNGTHNTSKEDYVLENYKDLYEEKLAAGLSELDAIEDCIQQAIIEGKLQVLQQGVAYGYITDDYKEVISPS